MFMNVLPECTGMCGAFLEGAMYSASRRIEDDVDCIANVASFQLTDGQGVNTGSRHTLQGTYKINNGAELSLDVDVVVLEQNASLLHVTSAMTELEPFDG